MGCPNCKGYATTHCPSGNCGWVMCNACERVTDLNSGRWYDRPRPL